LNGGFPAPEHGRQVISLQRLVARTPQRGHTGVWDRLDQKSDLLFYFFFDFAGYLLLLFDAASRKPIAAGIRVIE